MGKKGKIDEDAIQKDIRNGRFVQACDKYQQAGERKREVGDYEGAIKLLEKGLDISNTHAANFEASFCSRSLAEIYAMQGNYQESIYHADQMMKQANKSNKKSQIQLSTHVKAWCIMKLFDADKASKTELHEAVQLATRSREYLEENKESIRKHGSDQGTFEERKANLLILEGQLHQLLENNARAERLLEEASVVIGNKNKDIKYEILVTQCGLKAPDGRLEIARKLEECAPLKKVGNAIMEYSHQLVLQNRLKEGYSELIRAYVEHGKNMSEDDTNDIQWRLPIVFKLERYEKLLNSEKAIETMTKSEIYEAIADLYDAYYRTMTEKEKKEYSDFVKANIVRNYENMISHTKSVAVTLRGLLGIGLVYFDLEEYDEAKNSFEKRFDLLKVDNGSNKDIIDAEISIFKCECKLNNNNEVKLITMFENLEKRAQKPDNRQELYEIWSSHLNDIKKRKERDEYKSKADAIVVEIEPNADDESDKLFENISNEEILEKCVEDHKLMCLQISLRNQVDIRNKHGETKLHEAAKESNPKLVKMMISAGFDVNAKDNGGWTPLAEAIEKNQLENVILLINAGADVNCRSQVGCDNISGSSDDSNEHTGLTPLMDACCNGFVDIADILIKNGAKMEMRDSLGYTAYDHLKNFLEDNDSEENQRKFAVWMKTEMEKRKIDIKNAEKMTFHAKRRSLEEPSSSIQRRSLEPIVPVEDEDCFIIQDIPQKKRKRREGQENSEAKRTRTTFSAKRETSPEIVFFDQSPRLRRSPLVDLGDIGDIGFQTPHPVGRRSISPVFKKARSSSISSNKSSKNVSPSQFADSSPRHVQNATNSPRLSINHYDDVVVKVIFSSQQKQGPRINNAIFQMMRTANIEDVKSKILDHLKTQNFEITSIWQHSDVDRCVLTDDFCISLLGVEITLNCELSAAAASVIYRKSKDPIPEVLTCLEKFESTGFLDLSKILQDVSILEISNLLKNYLPSSEADGQDICLDLSRCDLTSEIETNLRSVVKNAKTLVIRAATSANYYQDLFEKYNGSKLEKVEFALLEFRDQSQLVSIISQFPNVQSLTIIGIKMPKCNISPISDVLKDFRKLTRLDLSATNWATNEDWEAILSKLENLKELVMNHVETEAVWQPDWLQNLEILSCRNSRFNWNSLIDFLSVSLVNRIDIRNAKIEKSIVEELRNNGSFKVISEIK